MSDCQCRINYAPWTTKYYCATCGKYFDDREHPPCGIYGIVKEEYIIYWGA